MSNFRPALFQSVLQHLPKGAHLARWAGRLLGHPVDAAVNGARYRLDLRETIQCMMFLGAYEPEQTAWFRECLRPGDALIDVGASFGYYTTLGSSLVGDGGRVFAFEPSPVASGIIERAVADSEIRNVVLTRAAVGSGAGSVSLFMPSTPELHSPSILKSDDSFRPLEVPVVALDDFAAARAVPKIRLVKIDVEGYEPNVIDGMQGLIRDRRIENIICEFNSGWLRRNNGTTPAALMQRILDLGFVVRASTALHQDLVGRHGERFDLQDVWFSAT